MGNTTASKFIWGFGIYTFSGISLGFLINVIWYPQSLESFSAKTNVISYYGLAALSIELLMIIFRKSNFMHKLNMLTHGYGAACVTSVLLLVFMAISKIM